MQTPPAARCSFVYALPAVHPSQRAAHPASSPECSMQLKHKIVALSLLPMLLAVAVVCLLVLIQNLSLIHI